MFVAIAQNPFVLVLVADQMEQAFFREIRHFMQLDLLSISCPAMAHPVGGYHGR
jgi:hypothetical protein